MVDGQWLVMIVAEDIYYLSHRIGIISHSIGHTCPAVNSTWKYMSLLLPIVVAGFANFRTVAFATRQTDFGGSLPDGMDQTRFRREPGCVDVMVSECSE